MFIISTLSTYLLQKEEKFGTKSVFKFFDSRNLRSPETKPIIQSQKVEKRITKLAIVQRNFKNFPLSKISHSHSVKAKARSILSKPSDPSRLRHPPNGIGLLCVRPSRLPRVSVAPIPHFKCTSQTIQLIPGAHVGIRAPGLVRWDRSRASNRPPQVVIRFGFRAAGNAAPSVV